METPSYSHLGFDDYKKIYPPSEDTFLLLDSLELELPNLLQNQPLICVEVGSGSGIIISALAKYLNYQSHGFLAIDINRFACDATKKTSLVNGVNVEVINEDLFSSFKPNSIDLLVFNPPYVPTSCHQDADILEQKKYYDDEAEKEYNSCDDDKMLIKSWAGGVEGREIINRIIFNLDTILAPGGVLYLLVIKDNNPEKINADLKEKGYSSTQIMDRKIRGEHLIVLKISKIY
jgi:release factor glutamine methyltransferase